jgi:MFS family permease
MLLTMALLLLAFKTQKQIINVYQNETMKVSCRVGCLILAMSPLAGSSRAFCLGSFTQSTVASKANNKAHHHQGLQSHFPASEFRHHQTGRITKSSIQIRGGNSDVQEEDLKPSSPEETIRKRGMTAALATTYLTVMGAKCALPSVLALLISRSNGLTFPTTTISATGMTPQGHMAKLLGLSTLAVALGKLLLGPVIDTLGGIRALQVALTLLMALLATISCTQQFSLFAISWIFVDFIFSSCWAGCINSIHQSFPEREWGKQVGMLAVGARTGNALSFALFASLLYSLEKTVKQPWRQVFAISAALQLIPLSLLTYFGGKTLKSERNKQLDKPKQEPKPSLQASLATLTREAATPEFWLHLLSRSVLMVFASFLLFVPTLMSQVYGASNGIAAQTGAIYSLGCLLAVTFGSSWYSGLAKSKQALASVALTGMATVSSLLQLAHVTGTWVLTARGAAASMFLWGFAFSIPFYLPPSLYALSRGGKQSSATIADAFDIGGFALLAMFNGYVASINHGTPAAWIPTFWLTTACSLTSLISLPFAILRQ